MGTKQEFMVYPEDQRYREITEEEANQPPDVEDEGIPTRVEKADGMLILTCLCYYSSDNVFELKITRPLNEAMAIYIAALRADDAVESGLLVAERIK